MVKRITPRDKYDPVRLAGVQFDDEDRTLLGRYKWILVYPNGKAYVCRYTTLNGKKLTIFLHRELMAAQKGQFVDHEDGDGLNNRRKNLRFTTRTGNNQNVRRAKVTSKSGVMGVHRMSNTNRWGAQIQVEGVVHKLGGFATKEEAGAAYLAAKRRLHPTCSI